MKCEFCGAQIPDTSKRCEYCDSAVTPIAKEEPKKTVCPKCGSNLVHFQDKV